MWHAQPSPPAYRAQEASALQETEGAAEGQVHGLRYKGQLPPADVGCLKICQGHLVLGHLFPDLRKGTKNESLAYSHQHYPSHRLFQMDSLKLS